MARTANTTTRTTAPEVAEQIEDPATIEQAETEQVDTEQAENTDPFAALEEAIPAEYKRNVGSTIDYEAITSPRVKADLLKSFNGYVPAKNDAGEELVNKPGKSFWLTQKFPSAAIAAEYLKQAKKYGAFKEWTVRSTFIDDKTLRFCAKPKENRKTA